MMEPINPSVWRKARRNTARKVNAVRIARGGVPGLPAPGRARRGAPPLDRLVGEPDRQAPALAQAGVVLAPVHHLPRLPQSCKTLPVPVPVRLGREGGGSIRKTTLMSSWSISTRFTSRRISSRR